MIWPTVEAVELTTGVSIDDDTVVELMLVVLRLVVVITEVCNRCQYSHFISERVTYCCSGQRGGSGTACRCRRHIVLHRVDLERRQLPISLTEVTRILSHIC